MTPNRTAAAKDAGTKKMSRFARHWPLIALLFFLHFVWFQVLGYGEAFKAPSDLLPDIPLEQFAFFAASIVSCCLLMKGDKVAYRLNSILLVSTAALLFIGVGMLLLAQHQYYVPQQLLSVFGRTAIGLGHPWILLSMFRLFKYNGTLWNTMLLLIINCVLANLAVTAILEWLPLLAQTITALAGIPLIFILLACAQRALRLNDEHDLPIFSTARLAAIETFRTSRAVLSMVVLALLVCAGVVILRTVSGSLWGYAHTNTPLFGSLWELLFASVLYLPLALLFFYGCTHHRVQAWRQITLLVMLFGLALLLFLRTDSESSPAFISLAIFLEWFGQSYFTYSLIGMMRHVKLSAFRVMGFATFVTGLLSLAWLLLPSLADRGISLIVLTLIYLTVLFIISLRSTVTNKELELDSGDLSTEERLQGRCTQLAKRAGLTPRETEILRLLAHGDSLPIIQTKLSIAEGTARTHVKHVYEKLDIHTRQELLALFL